MNSDPLVSPEPNQTQQVLRHRSQDQTLANLQGLRAVAALGVVVFHFGLMPPTQLPFRIGAYGVDVFFVLSGFIIAYSSTRSARHFLARRLIRVLPAYWIATIIAALFTLQNMDVVGASEWLVQSLFYLPHPHGRSPLIFVAWTLVYELAFYLLYWLALRAGTRNAPLLCLGLLVMFALVQLPGLPGPWPLLLEFGMGIGIYLMVERYAVPQFVPSWAGLLLAAAGLALLVTLPRMIGYNPDNYQSVWRVLCWGLPAALIVLGLILAEREGFAIRSRFVLLLGGASYAIYLLHPVVVGQLLQLPPNAPPWSWVLCLLAVVVTVAVSIAFHLLVELPILRRLRSWLGNGLPFEQRLTVES